MEREINIKYSRCKDGGYKLSEEYDPDARVAEILTVLRCAFDNLFDRSITTARNNRLKAEDAESYFLTGKIEDLYKEV